MSAYLSFLTAAGGYLFTDGAAYDDDGVIGAFVTKVACSTKDSFAVTSLGNHVLGMQFQRYLPKMVDDVGLDEFVDTALPQFLAEMREQDWWKDLTKGRGAAVVHMVGHSKTKGNIHFNFQTVDEPDEGIPAYEVRIVQGPIAGRGSMFSPEKFGEIRQQAPGESADAYLRYFGTQAMELMRLEKGRSMHLNGTDVPKHHIIGGHVDLTIVDAAGARTERIHVWDDKIGDVIRPGKVRQTVATFPGMNRQQRRAAERAQRKIA